MLSESELIEQSGILKPQLVEFGRGPRYTEIFNDLVEAEFGAGARVDEAALVNFIDWFLLEHPLEDGRTVVEQFVDSRPDLSEDERALLLGWRDVVEQIFEVQGREGESLILLGLLDELTYRVRSSLGPGVLAQMPAGSFVITRIVPVGEAWMLSGVASTLPASSRLMAVDIAMAMEEDRPDLVFRNPAKLAQALAFQRDEHARFVAFFGADLVVLPGRELGERLKAYMLAAVEDYGDSQEQGRRALPAQVLQLTEEALKLSLPPDVDEMESVGLIYDEIEGLGFYEDLGAVMAAFDHPERAEADGSLDAVLWYLEDPDISPLPLRRLAERDPERASRLLRLALEEPAFSWERDGEALLRREKPGYAEEPRLPPTSPHNATLERLSAPPERRRARRAAGRKTKGRR